MDVVEFRPGDRGRYLRARPGPDRPGTEDGLVRSVLVVVDEYPRAALLLPPGRRDQVRTPPLKLTRDRDRAQADLVGVPPRRQAHIDMQSPVACCLRIANDAYLSQQRFQFASRLLDVREVDARRRVKVYPQLIGVLRIISQVRPDVEAEAAKIH